MKAKSCLIIVFLSCIVFTTADSYGCSNIPPDAVLVPVPQYAYAGETVTLDGSGSSDPDGTIVRYDWDFTDNGSYDYYETSSYKPDGVFDGNTTYTYSSVGTYTAKLRVKDDDDAYDYDNTCTVYVKKVKNVTTGIGYDTIQAALNAAANGNIIVVSAGTYNEAIDFKGVSCTLKSVDPNDWEVVAETIIDANDPNAYVVTLDADGAIKGFTITGGELGIYCDEASPAISNCVITDNDSNNGGGGMYDCNSAPVITDCFFIGNDANNGGGIYDYNSTPTIINCVFADNTADVNGGAIYNDISSPNLINCTISGNYAGNHGGGMYSYGSGSEPNVINCIFWGNEAGGSGDEIYNEASADPNFKFCDIQSSGGSDDWNTSLGNDDGNNIDIDPYFANSSQPSGYDRIAGTIDDGLRIQPNGPCVDIADGNTAPSTDVLGLGRVDINDVNNTGSGDPNYADIGAYEAYVTWYVDEDATGNNDGSSWGDAFTNLQDALSDANDYEQIWVAKGTYEPNNTDPSVSFELSENVGVYGGFAGTEVVRSQRDRTLYNTILSGDITGDNSYHVVVGADRAVLDGFTITGGIADGSSANSKGGGIYCYETSPVISNCVIADNNSNSGGAGIYCNGSDTIVINCFISGNEAGTDGGGMHNKDSSTTITNCTFSTNSSQIGGAVSNFGSSCPTLTNCTISNNSASNKGGGIANEEDTCSTLTNCIIWGNEADTSDDEVYNLAGYGNSVLRYCDANGCMMGGSWNSSFGTNGGGNIDADPCFIDVNNPDGNDDVFGTLDDGLRLEPDSPCIDAADGDAAPSNDTLTLPRIDIAGVSNTGHGELNYADIGAYEYSNVIYVDNDASAGGDGRAWSTAYKYLQDALDNSSAGDEIWVYKGTYTPGDERDDSFELKAGVEIYGGFTGGETVRDDRDWINNQTILSGDIGQANSISDNIYHVVINSGNAADAVLDGFTITAGNADGSDANSYGGGMYFDGAWPAIRNCIITRNTAAAGGGGMYNKNGSSAELVNCLFCGNSADDGGAIYNDSSSPSLINCTISTNKAADDGGGIYDSNSSPTVAGSILRDNTDTGGTDETAQIFTSSGTPVVTYSCIQDANADDSSVPFNGSGNTTNIDDDPLFEIPGQWNADDPCATITLTVTIRDFMGTQTEVNAKSSSFPGVQAHPDFERSSSGIDEELVEATLTNKKPVYNPSGDDKNAIEDSNSFYQWYHDDSTVNMTGTIELVLHDNDSNGIYVYDTNCTPPSNDFFPIDDGADPCLFGTTTDKAHNFHFTLELHTQFTYKSGQEFIFSGDDDLWVFVDDQLVVDIGGIHAAISRRIVLEDGYVYKYTPENPDEVWSPTNPWSEDPCDSNDLGLDPNHTYDFDLFFAERHTTESDFYIGTSIVLGESFTDGDYRLQAGSACIDAGDNESVPSGLSADLACEARFLDDPNTKDLGSGTRPIVDMGAYEYQITGDNLPPFVNAGRYAPIELDESGSVTLQLEGIATDDGLPYPPGMLTTQWSLAEGPKDVDFNDTAELDTTVTFYKKGEYTLKLIADDSDLEEIGYTKIRVGSGPNNKAPTVIASLSSDPENIIKTGTVSLPNSVNIYGIVSDDGLPHGILTKYWSLEWSDGGEVTFADPCSKDTFAEFDKAGKYVLKLTVSDGLESPYDSLMVIVEGELINVKAGSDKDIESQTLATTPVTFDLDSRTGADEEIAYVSANIETWSWNVFSSNPAGGLIFSDDDGSERLNPTVIITQPGVYILELEGTYGTETESDQMVITVDGPEPNEPGDLAVYAGVDRIITLPEIANLTDANVSGSSASGAVFQWSVVAIETKWSFETFDDLVLIDPESGDAADVCDTTMEFFKPGTYTLELDAWNGMTAAEPNTVTITVLPGAILGGGEDHTLIIGEDKGVWACGQNGDHLGGTPGWYYRGVLGIDSDDWDGSSDILVPVLSGDQDPCDTGTVLSDIDFVAAGWMHSLALDKGGNLWSWGDDRCGKLGVGGTSDPYCRATPVKVLKGDQASSSNFLEDIVAIAAGRSGNHSLAVESNGVVWAWGLNNEGQLGNNKSGIYDFNSLPVQVHSGEQDINYAPPTTVTYLDNIVSVAAGAYHSMALERLDDDDLNCNGRIYAWGNNENAESLTSKGCLGNGTTVDSPTPVMVYNFDANDNDIYDDGYLENIVAISAGWHHSMALDKDGYVYTWGDDYFNSGLLGDGNSIEDANFSTIPFKVLAPDVNGYGSNYLKDIVAISGGESHCMALDKNGHVWTWGSNNNEYHDDPNTGQLGNGDDDYNSVSIPVQVVAPDVNDYDSNYLENIIAISAGYWHCIAMDKDGFIYTWGKGYRGRLGIGSQDSKNIPQRIPPLGSKVHNVTQDEWFAHIQSAIDDSNTVNGDLLVAWPGKYEENIDFGNKSLILRSTDPNDWDIVENTIIYGFREGSESTVVNIESDPMLAGFKVTRCENEDPEYGIVCNNDSGKIQISNCIIEDIYTYGIHCTNGSSVKITNTKILENGSINGHGIYCDGANLEITGSVIKDNYGAGIYCKGSSTLTVVNNEITGSGYGIQCDDSTNSIIATIKHNQIHWNFYGIRNNTNSANSSLTVTNNRIIDNTYYGIELLKTGEVEIKNNWIYGSVIGIDASYAVDISNNTIAKNNYGISAGNGTSNISNCIFWGNNTQIYVDTPNVTYCCVQGGYTGTGTGNIDSDPCFVNIDSSDFHLRPDSPCIDAGDPYYSPDAYETDIDSELRVVNGDTNSGGVVDMGADEFMPLVVKAGDYDAQLTTYDNVLVLDDASIVDNNQPNPPNPLYDSVQWSYTGPANGMTFVDGQGEPNSNILQPTAIFATMGTYVLKLEAKDDSNGVLGGDTVTVDVRLGVDTGFGYYKAVDGLITYNGSEYTYTASLEMADAIYDSNGLMESHGTITTSWFRVQHCVLVPSDISGIGEGWEPDVNFIPNNYELQPTVTFDNKVLFTVLYDLALAVYEDGQIIGSDTVTIIVKNAEVEVDAGTYPDIMLSQEGSVTLKLSETVVGGPPNYSEWLEYDCPAGVYFGWSDGYHTATFYEAGEYELLFQVIDTYDRVIGADIANVKVIPYVGSQNQAVVDANCGTEPTMTDVLLLSDGVYIDLCGCVVSGDYNDTYWYDPHGKVVFGDADALETTATFYEAGVYTLHLYAVYQDEIVGADIITITMHSPKLVVEITPELDWFKRVPSGNMEVDLEAVITGSTEYDPCSLDWFIGGDDSSGQVTFEQDSGDPLKAVATFTSSVNAGTYKFALKVKDFDGYVIGMDVTTITVIAENKAPLVYAGPDMGDRLSQSNVLDVNLVYAWACDENWAVDYPDILPGGVTCQWSSNPSSGVSFDDDEDLNPAVTFTTEGTYILTLTVTDEDQASDSNTVTIEVFPKENPPIVYAGSDQTITMPVSVTCLEDAFVTLRSDGQASMSWSVDPNVGLSFMNTDSFVNPVIYFSDANTYTFTLTVNYQIGGVDQNSISDTVTIYVEDDEEDDDEKAPVISEFTIDSVDINDVNYPVSGNIHISIKAEDVESGMYEILLLLDGEETGYGITGIFLDNVTCEVPYVDDLQLDYTLDTTLVSDSNHNLLVYLEDISGGKDSNGVHIPGNYAIVTETFDVNNADKLPGDPPVARITNDEFYDDTYVYKPKANPLPVLTEGLFELQGIANHSQEGTIKYKLQLFESKIGQYDPNYWNQGYSIYNEYYVKDINIVTSEHSYEKPWYVGSVGEVDEPNTFGTVDLTGVENGSYQLLLTVEFDSNEANIAYAYANVGFVLDCPLKIGNVKFSQEDLVIPVGGMPLRVIRTYDSLSRNRDGDFGYGWSYSIANMDIELDENRTELGPYDYCGTTTAPVRFGSNFGRNVTLTLPDGRRSTFLFWLKPEISSLYGIPTEYSSICYKAMYDSPPGVYATLEPYPAERMVEAMTVDGIGYLWNGQGNSLIGAEDPANYDFEGYKLTTADGTQYIFERERYCDDGDIFLYEGLPYYANPQGPLYLNRIFTPSGEKIELNVNLSNGRIGQYNGYGIQYKDCGGNVTKAIELVYDYYGRIVEVYAPSEKGGAYPTIEYVYDDYGNLEQVKKLVDKTASEPEDKYEVITYVYDNNEYDPDDHYVTEIKDPRGLSPIRYVYDDNGRLVKVIDAKNNEIVLTHGIDSDANTETVTDRYGNPTIYGYNDRGNVVTVTQIVNSEERTTTYAYEDDDNPDSPTSTTVLVPAEDPNADPVESTTRYWYDPNGRTRIIIDPVDNVTTNIFDPLGNVTESTQWQPLEADVNFPSDYPYNEPNSQEYEEVSTTRNFYTDKGLLVFSGSTTGQGEQLQWHSIAVNYYNDKNLPKHIVRVDVNEVSDFGAFNSPAAAYFDDVNNLNGIDLHIITTYDYDSDNSGSSDQPYSISEPYYGSDAAVYNRYFHYDDNGNQDETWYQWDDPNSANPDLYVINVTDYDDAGRVTGSRRLVDDEMPYNEQYLVSEVILSTTTYNSIGKPAAVESEHLPGEYGILTEYDYDEIGNLVETRSYEPVLVEEEYQYELLTTSRTLYDAEGRVLVSVGPYASSDEPVGTENVYDELGRVIETRRWANVQINLEDLYNDDNEIIGMAVADGIEPQNAWDGTGTEPNIGWTSDDSVPQLDDELSYSRSQYDIAGRIEMSVSLDEDGYEQPTSYVYDIAGRQIAVIDPCGHDITYDGNEPYRIYEAPFYSDNRCRTVTAYKGSRRDYVVDARGNISGADPNDYKTSFGYDALGRIATTIHPPTVFDGSSGAEKTYTHLGYDGLGRKDWQAQQCAESEPNQLYLEDVRQYDYDAAGRLIAATLPEVNDPNTSQLTQPTYEYEYDDYGNPSLIRDALGRETTFTYDHLHRQISRTLPGGQSESKEYDDLGRIKTITDFKDQITVFEYDNRGQLEYKRYYIDDSNYSEANPTYNASPEIYYTYDDLGRKTSVVTTKYDYQGQEVSSCQTDYYYDVQGRIHVVASAQGYIRYDYSDITGRKTQTRSYTADANLYTDVLAGSSNDTSRMQYSYDALGRLETVTTSKCNGTPVNPPAVTTYIYNAVGSREAMELPNGLYTEYNYDALNRLVDVNNYSSSAKSTTLSSFMYTVAENGMRRWTDEVQRHSGSPPENETHDIEYTYDKLNRLIEESADDGSSNGYTGKYVYDLVGNREQRIVTANGQTLTTDYDYDNNDRLLTETHTGPVAAIPLGSERVYAYISDDGTLSYKLPGSDIRIGQFKAFFMGLPSRWSLYLFIALLILVPAAFFGPVLAEVFAKLRKAKRKRSGSRLSLYHRCMSVLLAYVMLLSPGVLESVAQGAFLYSQASTADNWHKGDRTIEYEYDANGSVIEKVTIETSTEDTLETVTYDYNLQNRLEKQTVKDPNDAVLSWTEFEYDEQGVRVESKHYNGSTTITTQYLIDSYNHTGYAQVFEEYDGTNRKVYLIGQEVFGHDLSGTQFYYLRDGHGSTRQLTYSTIPIENYAYDGYGVAVGFNPSTAVTSNLYAGEQYDSNLSQYYLRARYYDPANGRFNRVDPYAGNNQDPQSLHKYLYCHANPINNIDPSGRLTLTEIQISAKLYVSTMYARLVAAFAAGGAAVGRLWNAIGAYVQLLARQVFSLFPKIQVYFQTHVGSRIIDFTLRLGSRVAQLEVKYSIPRAGEALNRLVGQINAMTTYGQGQSVIWTLKEPTAVQLQNLQNTLGATVFNQVQFVHGVEGLFQWITMYFGF